MDDSGTGLANNEEMIVQDQRRKSCSLWVEKVIDSANLSWYLARPGSGYTDLIGRVAQAGERCLDMAEVAGSIPAAPTKSKPRNA